MFKASTVYWCNIPIEKPGSRNCGTGKVIKVESSKMQERHDEAKTEGQHASQDLFLTYWGPWFWNASMKLMPDSTCSWIFPLSASCHASSSTKSTSTTGLSSAISRVSSWRYKAEPVFHPGSIQASKEQNKYTKHIQNIPEQSLITSSNHPWTNFWGPEHDLMLKECPCAAPAKLFQWRATGKREALAWGQESQSCRIIHCLPFLYLAHYFYLLSMYSTFVLLSWACPNSTHTHMRSLFEGLFASATLDL